MNNYTVTATQTKRIGKIVTLSLLLIFFLASPSLFAQEKEEEAVYKVPFFSAHLGFDFFAWNTPFLVTGGDVRFPIGSALYASLGADFGIHTDSSGDQTEASFLFPLRLGLLFPFPGERVSFGFTAGLSPVFLFDGGTTFFMGPYVGGRVRVTVHPVLSFFLDLQQSLLFGGSDWINSGTRITAGISF